MEAINIAVVVDDHPLVARGVADFLRSHCQFDEVQVALNESELWGYIDLMQPPTLVVLDFWLSSSFSLALLAQLKQKCPRTAVLVNSADGDATVQKKVQSAGANGFIHKQESPHIFAQAVASVTAGEHWFKPSNPLFIQSNTDLIVTAQELGLTPRQGEILAMILKGYPNKRIAQILSLSEQTVKEHVSRILERLGVHNRVQAIGVLRGKRLEYEK